MSFPQLSHAAFRKVQV
ncbi:hypothetical protein VULLAG_LOCUS13536 [Vulpes lagopus]